MGFGFWVKKKRGHELHELDTNFYVVEDYTNFYVVEDCTNFIRRWVLGFGFGFYKKGDTNCTNYTRIFML